MNSLPFRLSSSRGSAMVTVMVLCAALLVTGAAFYGTLMVNGRIGHRAQLLTEARNGAEALLGFASAELNRRAVSFATLSQTPLAGYAPTSAQKDAIADPTSGSHLVPSSLDINPGPLSPTITVTTLFSTDPVYSADESAGQTLGVRTGEIFATASAKDPISGQLIRSSLAATVQLREQAWFNYGFFYNMDMEFYNGPRMDVFGAVHTNADLYLACASSSSTDPNTNTSVSTLNFRQKITAAGHIYRGLKYCIKSFNTDGTPTGFENKPTWGTGTAQPGEGYGQVWCTNGTTLVRMAANNDCLGTKTSYTANLSNWITQEKETWKDYVMDSSRGISRFTPPELPLYVPENFATPTTVELRNHGYAMIEPQLPLADNNRYYGHKGPAENIKFSAHAGFTIVVDDIDRDRAAGLTTESTQTASANGYAIPWKIVWYKGSTLPNKPINKENLPARGLDGLPVILGMIDPFDTKNDEVDKISDASVVVKMRRNLKALLRDAIVVVPYKDGETTTPYGSGNTTASITTYGGVTVSTVGKNRYDQPAGRVPNLNSADSLTYNPYFYGNTIASNGSDSYPTSSFPGPSTPKWVNTSAGAYSGFYDRRTGFDGALASTSGEHNDGLKGAMHCVHIDLQKLNWILNHKELWQHPETGALIYDTDVSYNNIIYVDLPSDTKNSFRHGLSGSDKICHALRPTETTPGYCVVLKNGARLPRLPYNEDIRTPGFTFATNGALYLHGNFNADGLSTTGSSQQPDSPNWYSAVYSEAEVPALVAGDTVTFLTRGFAQAASNKAPANGNNTPTATALTGPNTVYNGYNGNTTPISGNFWEISTAVVTGLTATIPYYYLPSKINYSGSVNNLPRFLENNGGIPLRYRGSMAALYECEVMRGYFVEGSHGYWYAPPNRDWGYHQYLGAGRYPPATPVIRTARLINVRDISTAQYEAGPQVLP